MGDNSIVSESGYIKKSKCKGDNFEVGSIVFYGGDECVVSKAVDSDGDLKVHYVAGIKAITAAPETNTTITKWDISNNNVGVEGCKVVAQMLEKYLKDKT